MKLVEVEWTDSCKVGLGWDDVETYIEKHAPDVCRSVGWLVDDKPESIMLAANATFVADNAKRSADSINDAMVIPRSVIRSITDLGKRRA